MYTNEYTEPVPWPDSEPVTPTDEIRVFLLGGQSNADGRADPSGQPSYSDIDFYSDTQKRVGIHTDLYAGASETGQFGPELSFGRRITDLLGCASTTRVAVVKYANAGTNLKYQWKAGGDATTLDDGSEYVTFQQTVSDGLAALASKYTGAVITVEGMIWQQGERDAVLGYTNEYQSNLNAFIADVRETFGANMPFVIGGLSDAQTAIAAPALTAIQDAQNAVDAADERTGLVDTDAMTMNADNLHFNVDSQLALGKEFAYEMAYLLWVASQLTPEDIDAGKGAPNADPDLDGIVNSDEFIAGTDVMDADAKFRARLDVSAGNTFDIVYPAQAGRLYLIDSCTNLTDDSWVNLTTYTNETSGTLPYSVTNNLSHSFFRVRAQLP